MHRVIHTVIILACLLTPTMIPSLGVSAFFGVVLTSQIILGQRPTWRNSLAGILSALPTPVALGAPLLAYHTWWQRLILSGALAIVWAPVRPEIQWGVVVVVAGMSLITPHQRDAWRWYVPWVQLAALQAWPQWWDVGVVVLSLLIGGIALWQRRSAYVRWSIVMLLLALNTGAGLAVAPWAMVVAVVGAPWLLIMVVWATTTAVVASGAALAVIIGLVALIRLAPQLTWPIPWRVVGVWMVWALVPVTATEARLQTSLSVYGRLWGDGALTMVNAGQQAVATLPWLSIVATLVVLGSIAVQWRDEERHVE
jgi:hypothetical protein